MVIIPQKQVWLKVHYSIFALIGLYVIFDQTDTLPYQWFHSKHSLTGENTRLVEIKYKKRFLTFVSFLLPTMLTFCLLFLGISFSRSKSLVIEFFSFLQRVWSALKSNQVNVCCKFVTVTYKIGPKYRIATLKIGIKYKIVTLKTSDEYRIVTLKQTRRKRCNSATTL